MIPVNVMHQKLVVVDERLVFLGSLNALSQSRTREVMVLMDGAHFARRLLEHEHAEDFADPPRCGECHDDQVDLRRNRKLEWHWHCHSRSCRARRPGGRAWTMPVTMSANGRGRQPGGG